MIRDPWWTTLLGAVFGAPWIAAWLWIVRRRLWLS
jgi:hypothetical protein